MKFEELQIISVHGDRNYIGKLSESGTAITDALELHDGRCGKSELAEYLKVKALDNLTTVKLSETAGTTATNLPDELLIEGVRLVAIYEQCKKQAMARYVNERFDNAR